MDTSVALVQTYLRVNGYFTVAEFPVVETRRRGKYRDLRTLTDIDIMAFRFPRARRLVPAHGAGGAGDVETSALDPALGAPPDRGDMIIGEVKEGHAELNAGATDPAVLRAALARFGCCTDNEAALAARELMRKGHVLLPHGHSARLVAFGSTTPPGSDSRGAPVHCVALPHVFDYLRTYVATNWRVMKTAGTKDPALGWLLLEEKSVRAKAKEEPS